MRKYTYPDLGERVLLNMINGRSCSIKLLSDDFYIDDIVISSEGWQELIHDLPIGVNLLAVSKGHPASSIRTLVRYGQINFGESRVQEALPKIEELSDSVSLHWHFIGRLQTNKVRAVVRSFDFIHSIDSSPLAERVSRISVEERRCPKVFFQVKFREDSNKCGFEPRQIREHIFSLRKLPNLDIMGLMAIPPIGLSKKERIDLFYQCRDLAKELDLLNCSMGMSRDWRDAVNAGATWVRLGSALFGARL